jgi:hypothetical protein
MNTGDTRVAMSLAPTAGSVMPPLAPSPPQACASWWPPATPPPAAGFITGTTLPVDGELLAGMPPYQSSEEAQPRPTHPRQEAREPWTFPHGASSWAASA